MENSNRLVNEKRLAMRFLKKRGDRSSTELPKSKMDGPKGPIVTDACVESESSRVKREASLKKKRAA